MKRTMIKTIAILMICLMAMPSGMIVNAESVPELPKTNMIDVPAAAEAVGQSSVQLGFSPEEYNEHDAAALRAWLEQVNEDGVKNGDILCPNYDPDYPETWNDDEADTFTWDEEGFLTAVSISNLLLFGSLDLSGCERLQSVTNYSGIACLRFSECSALKSLTCQNGPTEEIYVDGCDSLEFIWIGGSQMRLTSFDASDLPSLRMLGYKQGYREINLQSIDVSNCPSLFYLELDGTDIESIDLLEIPSLTTFNALCKVNDQWGVGDMQPLSTINVAGHPNMEYLWVDNSMLAELDVSDCHRLGSIYMTGNNSLESITFKDNTNLYNIQNYISPNLEVGVMTEIDFSQINSESSSISVTLVRSSIEHIDFTPLAGQIAAVMLNDNPLTGIDLTGCSALLDIQLVDTEVACLDLSDCTSLETFEFSGITSVVLNSEALNVTDSVFSAVGGTLYGIRTYEYIENPETGNWDLVYYPVTLTAEGGDAEFYGWYNTENDIQFYEECTMEVEGSNYRLEARFALPTLIGDVDGDGNVSVADATLVLRFSLGLDSLTTEQIAIADMNGDGSTNVMDATLIIRTAMNIE